MSDKYQDADTDLSSAVETDVSSSSSSDENICDIGEMYSQSDLPRNSVIVGTKARKGTARLTDTLTDDFRDYGGTYLPRCCIVNEEDLRNKFLNPFMIFMNVTDLVFVQERCNRDSNNVTIYAELKGTTMFKSVVNWIKNIDSIYDVKIKDGNLKKLLDDRRIDLEKRRTLIGPVNYTMYSCTLNTVKDNLVDAHGIPILDEVMINMWLKTLNDLWKKIVAQHIPTRKEELEPLSSGNGRGGGGGSSNNNNNNNNSNNTRHSGQGGGGSGNNHTNNNNQNGGTNNQSNSRTQKRQRNANHRSSTNHMNTTSSMDENASDADTLGNVTSDQEGVSEGTSYFSASHDDDDETNTNNGDSSDSSDTADDDDDYHDNNDGNTNNCHLNDTISVSAVSAGNTSDLSLLDAIENMSVSNATSRSPLQQQQQPKNTVINVTDQQQEEYNHNFLSAAGNGNIDIIRQYIQNNTVNVETKDPDGFTALYVASEEGHFEIVQYLLQVGKANVEATTKYGLTPLHVATQQGHLPIVQYLLQVGKANVEATRNDGLTPLHVASYQGHFKIVRYLLQDGKANVEATMNDGFTPLHVASQEGHFEIVQYLLQDGKANVEATMNDGATPLHVASEEGHFEIVQYLLQDGKANVEATTNNGDTPLHVASLQGRFEIVQYLKDVCGARVSVQAEDSSTPLFIAEENNSMDVVEFLTAKKELDKKSKTTPDFKDAHIVGTTRNKNAAQNQRENTSFVDSNSGGHIVSSTMVSKNEEKLLSSYVSKKEFDDLKQQLEVLRVRAYAQRQNYNCGDDDAESVLEQLMLMTEQMVTTEGQLNHIEQEEMDEIKESTSSVSKKYTKSTNYNTNRVSLLPTKPSKK